MTRFLAAALALAALPAAAQEMSRADLAGIAVLPASSFSAPPPDAPDEAWISGRFTAGTAPVREPMSIAENGVMRPFFGQPLQGFSGFAAGRARDGSLFALIDNGFGSKANSSDALLGFTRIMPDFEGGGIEVRERVWLHDPDRRVPFRIVHEATDKRYLTGADFDPESIQVVGDTVWIGEEFGPYLVSAGLDGRVTGVYPARVDGVELRSPDHPALRAPAVAGRDWRVPGSGGFEGLALAADGRTLWGMLERPLLDASGAREGDFLRALAFDTVTRTWTGESFRLALTPGAGAIGDFNFIDATRALVIERDGGQGHPSAACADGAAEGCFPNPARVKRVTLIDTAAIDDEGFVRRRGQIDLMDIRDPEGLGAGRETTGEVPEGTFVFPFVTIEGVVRDGEAHILVSNDNNLPFSAGRAVGRADDNEIIRLHVPALLSAE